MNRVEVAGGKLCPACGLQMQRYEKLPTFKPTPGRGHYRYWDICQCGRIQNYMQAFVPAEAKNANIQPSKSELNKELDRNLKEAREAKKQAQKLLTRQKPKKIDAAAKRAARKARKRNRLNRHIPEMNEILRGGHPSVIPSKADKDLFYASWEWQTLRKKTLNKYGAECQCCGASRGGKTIAGVSVVIHVDHIKPISRYWNLRLDPTNTQILCAECNQGKGAWDETDHRPKPKGELDDVIDDGDPLMAEFREIMRS